MATRQGSLVIVNTDRIKSRGALSVVEARTLVLLKYLPGLISAAVANPFLYLIAVGVGVGKLINAHAGGVDGVKYLTFLAPALLSAAAIQNVMDEVVFPTIEGFKWNKIFFAINATPISGKQIANGVLLAALIRVFFSVTIYGTIVYLFGGFTTARGWLAIPTSLCAAAAFGAFIMGVAAWAKNDDSFFMVLGRFVMMPLFLFSGTFYQLSSMPIFLRWIGWLSPLWHTTELGRFLTYGHHISALMFFVHIGFLIAMFTFGMYFSHRQFERRLSK
ncbi:MAG: ABC transporter permease [Actinomycetota bacterium]